MSEFRILVVDDEELMRDYLYETLKRKGYNVEIAKNGKEAIKILEDNNYNLVITDMKMPEITGMDVLRFVKEKTPDTFVVVLTAYGTVENAVEAMKIGAYDYLMKPCTADEIEILVDRVKNFQNVIAENKLLKSQLFTKYDLSSIIGISKPMKKIFELIKTVAKTKATVLITGESGTGKELVARAIHYNSPRRDKPFIKMNCAALPEGLVESELFGHEKGSFTGAIRQTTGKFGLADGGTILLDEISEISLNLQAKLLRVLQEKEFERVGGSQTIKVDVRVIATTNRDLLKEIANNNFREDLYYRLNVFPIKMPPLRERKEDIPALVNHFIEKFSLENGVPIRKIHKDALEKLMNYDWPGNVRELENTIERATIISKSDIITPDDIIIEENIPVNKEFDLQTFMNTYFGNKTIAEIEKDAIFVTLRKCGNNKTKAAEKLGISIRTLRNKLNEYRDAGLIPEDFDLKQE